MLRNGDTVAARHTYHCASINGGNQATRQGAQTMQIRLAAASRDGGPPSWWRACGAAALAAALALPGAVWADGPRTWIVGATVISPERGDDGRQLNVLIEGERIAALAQAGAKLLFGTDTPSSPMPGNLPGLNGYLEMQRLVAAKLSLRQLLQAATINNANAFGLAHSVGSIEVGKRANLLLLARSPLLSVDAYDTIQTLWQAGRQLDPAGLEAGR